MPGRDVLHPAGGIENVELRLWIERVRLDAVFEDMVQVERIDSRDEDEARELDQTFAERDRVTGSRRQEIELVGAVILVPADRQTGRLIRTTVTALFQEIDPDLDPVAGGAELEPHLARGANVEAVGDEQLRVAPRPRPRAGGP